MEDRTLSKKELPLGFSKQIRGITNDLAVKDGKIYRRSCKPKEHKNRYGNSTDCPLQEATKEIAEEMGMFGADKLDVTMLLSYYIYRHYYAGGRKGEEPEIEHIPQESEAPVDDIIYKDIDKDKTDYWMDSYWQYAPGVINRKYNSRLVLRRGSQATWVKNGVYAEYSTTTDDDIPLSRITSPTHAFVEESGTAIYNWIFGKYRPDNDQSGFVRFYFNLKPTFHAAQALTRAIKKNFNRYQIPFTFKFLAFAADYKTRSDTAILYVERKHLMPASYLIRDIYRYVVNEDPAEPLVNPEVSLFVKRLLDGLSFAEDPENNDSFGTSRCRAIARILMKEGTELSDANRRYQIVVQQLRTSGYNINQFYQNQYSIFDYEHFFNIIENQNSVGKTDKDIITNKNKYLDAAVDIAIKLCKEAVWFQSSGKWYCSWLTYEQEYKESDSKKPFGFKYNLLPGLKPEYYSSFGVSKYLKLIFEIYQSEIFKVTVDGSKENPLEKDDHEFSSLTQKWKDEDIRQAWDETFVNRNMEPCKRKELAEEIISRYIDVPRPIGNGFKNDDLERRKLFSANVRYGMAGMGYFFLFVNDPCIKLPEKGEY